MLNSDKISWSKFLVKQNDIYIHFNFICSKEAYRIYDQERKAKQDREELEREKFRSNIREKYGLAKKEDLREKLLLKVNF